MQQPAVAVLPLPPRSSRGTFPSLLLRCHCQAALYTYGDISEGWCSFSTHLHTLLVPSARCSDNVGQRGTRSQLLSLWFVNVQTLCRGLYSRSQEHLDGNRFFAPWIRRLPSNFARSHFLILNGDRDCSSECDQIRTPRDQNQPGT